MKALAAMKSPLPPELVSFIDAMPEPHVLCDRQYHVLAANVSYRRCFGDHRLIVGRTCYNISHGFDRPCDQSGEVCPRQRSLSSGRRECVLHRRQTPQGEVLISIELSPVRDAEGNIAYFVEKVESAARGGCRGQSLVGHAPAFERMLGLVVRVAPSEAAVLLLGESGTGKELVAKAIHDASRRSGKPFVAVDCSGLTETLFESELFGHDRGAFTGATSRNLGLVESASGGTLFLDEVGDIPLAMQVKLLRLLETGTYRRVGSAEPRKADVRLVSATHRDLRAMVEAGSFRRDLYFRLNTFPIRLPALRDRAGDIPLLAQSLLERVAPQREFKLSEAALDLLGRHDYPGNVRELRNILERATLLCDGDVLQPDHLAEELHDGHAWSRARTPAAHGVEALSAQTLEARLAYHRGSRKNLAAELGISERTLYRHLKRMTESQPVSRSHPDPRAGPD
jgi:two-component system, NtrC family, response regulator HydG